MMPSELPPGPIRKRKRVLDFGLGPYDRDLDDIPEMESHPNGESLPSGGGSSNPLPPDIIGYSTFPSATDVASLPGDIDRPYRSHHPAEDVIVRRVPSVAESRVPYGPEPPARSDYYDKLTVGESKLPGVSKNDASMDNFLGALGNMWSGFVTEDLTNPAGFPSRNFREDPDLLDGGIISEGFIASSVRRPGMIRSATNINLVTTLTDDFIKKHGKKGVVRRHVMSFLEESGYHTYLASDVIRCLAERHEIYVADVLDQFPTADQNESAKVASMIHDAKKIRSDLERMRPMHRNASSRIGRIVADFESVIWDLERFGNDKED